MAGSRTLKLSILADVDDLNRKLKQADNDVGGFTGQLDKFGKMAAAAFAAATAAAAAYAGKLAIDGVKAAIEDEAAQKRLAQTLQAATGATTAQIKATEDYITKMQLATGISDNELRAAMGRLTLSTNSVSKAQELLNLALDISRARQIPLENVANALGKAFDGQTTALTRLGLGFSAAEIKGKSFDDLQNLLTKSFGGAASAAANTYEIRVLRLQQAFFEFQERIGYGILPILNKFIDLVANDLVPNINKFLLIFEPIGDAIERNKESFQAFGQLLEKYVVPLLAVSFVAALKVVSQVAAGVIDIIGKVAGSITSVVNGAIGLINKLIEAYNRIPVLPNIPTIPTISAPSISIPKISTAVPSGGVSVPSMPSTATAATAGAKVATTAAVAGATLTAVTAPTQLQTQAGVLNKVAAMPDVTINIGVAGDPEGTARTIVDVLNRSYGRGALGAENLLL